MKILIEGASGRLARTQHLPALMQIRQESGLALPDGTRCIPEPVLLGRNAEKLQAQAQALGLSWSTDRASALADPEALIYFDASATAGRFERATQALQAGKHVYLEKPLTDTLEQALALHRLAEQKGLRNGVVQDKLALPGLHKMKQLLTSGALGQVLTVKLEFGWWIFDGVDTPAQRSSWNYQKSGGGGLILDMFPHWCYILERLIAPIESVTCLPRTLVPKRIDESGQPYEVDVEDMAMAMLVLQGGVPVQVFTSWSTRLRRDDMLTLHIDGSKGSAVCGLHTCRYQSLANTPKPSWNITQERQENFHDQWQTVPDVDAYVNSYRLGWEQFLSHVAAGTPFPAPFLAGARALQLIEACHRSHQTRAWVDLPAL
jgi:predicted dehydrogenase